MLSMAPMQAPMQASDRLPSPDAKGMLSDIYDTPEVLRKTLKLNIQDGSIKLPGLLKPLPEGHHMAGKTPMEVMAACTTSNGEYKNRFTIIGCGTSHHAALLAEYLIEHIARIPVEVQYASEYRYRQPITRPGDVFIAVSNSGETHDTVESLHLLQRSKGGKEVLTIGLVNEAYSTIGKEVDACLLTVAGVEAGVASTKVFSCTVLTFVLLAIALGEACGTLPDAERKTLLDKLDDLPGLVQEVIERESRPLKMEDSLRSLEIGECILWDISCQNVLAQNFIFLGRGCNFPIALEGAMKCKETAYIHAEGYPAAEMKHGPIALIDQFMPVVVIAPSADPCFDKIKANINEVATRSGSIIAITDNPGELGDLCEYVIRVPSTHEFLMPLVAVIPMQLLAYMMGILKGNEVDNPRGLRKSVSMAA